MYENGNQDVKHTGNKELLIALDVIIWVLHVMNRFCTEIQWSGALLLIIISSSTTNSNL